LYSNAIVSWPFQISALLMDHVALQEANEALDTIHQISQILDTGLDKETLSILIALCESGVNPEVAIVTHELAQRCLCLSDSIV